VTIHRISVNIAPRTFYSGVIVTEIQWIFTESQRLTDSNLECCQNFAVKFDTWLLIEMNGMELQLFEYQFFLDIIQRYN